MITIALTGTPGAGKSEVAARLREFGFSVYSVAEIAELCGALEAATDDAGSEAVVDLDKVRHNFDMVLSGLQPNRSNAVIIEGHLSHLLPVDIVVVLRCHPDIIRERLKNRRYEADKIQANVEAEAINYITAEACSMHDHVCEIDCSSLSKEAAALKVIEIIESRGACKGLEAPWVDWSEVILSWY